MPCCLSVSYHGECFTLGGAFSACLFGLKSLSLLLIVLMTCPLLNMSFIISIYVLLFPSYCLLLHIHTMPQFFLKKKIEIITP